MKRWGTNRRWSLITKVMIGSFLSVVCVAGIVVVTMLTFQQVESLLVEIIDRDVTRVVANADLGRDLIQIFSDTSLLLHQFVEHDELLQTEGQKLLQALQAAKDDAQDAPDIQNALQIFIRQLQVLFEHCTQINAVIEDIHAIQGELEAEFTHLEESVAEKMLLLAMEGKEDETFAVEQLSSMLPGYRLTLAQARIEFSRMKQTALGIGEAEQFSQQPIMTLLNDLITELGPVMTAGEDLQPLGTALIEHIKRYQEGIHTFYQAGQDFQQQLGELRGVQTQVIAALSTIDEQIVQTTEDIHNDVGRVMLAARQLIIVLSVIVTVVLLLAVYYVIRMIRPIRHLAQIAENLAEGDIGVTLPAKISQDEIGTLASAFQKLVNYLRDMATAATAISEGDLSRKIQPRSNHDMLGHAFLRMTTYLKEMASEATAIADGDLQRDVQPKTERDVLGQAFHAMRSLRQSISEIQVGAIQLREAADSLNQVSTQMVTNAGQASEQATMVSFSSQQISENVDAVASAIEEISAGIREISRNTAEASQIAEEAVKIANSANTTISDLESRSQEIGEVIKVITAITQQTNLLALNATIEAARAGDSGKGFAVVAREIKELSQETAASTEDIIQKLEAIRVGGQNAMKAITEVSNIIVQIRDLSSSTASGVEEQSMTTNEIARRMGEAAKGSQDITKVIGDVATVTQNTADGAADVQHSAGDLAALANRLQELVSRFKV